MKTNNIVVFENKGSEGMVRVESPEQIHRIPDAKEARRLVTCFRKFKAEVVERELGTKFNNVLLDIKRGITDSALKGAIQANIHVSKYLGTYTIGLIKYYLQLLGYDVSYHSSTEELIVIWK